MNAKKNGKVNEYDSRNWLFRNKRMPLLETRYTGEEPGWIYNRMEG